ncbi:unnamed protein product [Coffea canephora]|uniref:DH200=94 genomic scaffold, scaffold_11291 n=1 Tax=Coffea canephora TaxID=49390 RepID=A0A068VR14_COFCA|nr:unnamed protein product [Coffea canephora]
MPESKFLVLLLIWVAFLVCFAGRSDYKNGANQDGHPSGLPRPYGGRGRGRGRGRGSYDVVGALVALVATALVVGVLRVVAGHRVQMQVPMLETQPGVVAKRVQCKLKVVMVDGRGAVVVVVAGDVLACRSHVFLFDHIL